MRKRVTSGFPIRVISALSCFVALVAPTSSPASGADAGPGTGANPPVQAAQVPVSDRKIDGEIETVRQEIKEKPACSAYLRLGHLLLKKGAPDEAMQSFDEASKVNPRSHEAKTGKGIVLARLGEFEKAEQALRDALVLNPNPMRVHYELGLLFERRGDSGKAIAEFKESLKKYQAGRK